MKLYTTNTSPFGRKVRILLADKGMPYEQLNTPPSEYKQNEMAALNPGLKIPILQDGGRTLFESDLILAYLLRTYPHQNGTSHPPLAQDLTRPEKHWEDALVLSTINTLLDSGVSLRQLGLNGITPKQAPYLGRQQDRIQWCLDWLERQATPQGFIPGVFSIADIAFICAVGWGEWRGLFPWRGRSKLEALVALHTTRPSVADNPFRE
ncbi:MAG: glutathione S-transferase family protein [Deltaproteobacteria bacterium]|nr:glutathione S-transferase family protein [Deltaproteobacteria bacterium]